MLSYTTMQALTQFSRTFFDVLIMWLILYYAIKIVRNNSRTVQIFKGIILVVIIKAVANVFGLKTVGWMADTFVTYGFLAVIIIFQPEIRSLLEKLGKSNVFSRISTLSGNEKEALVDELVKATMLLAQDQTGALICLEQGHSLNDYIKTGTPLNSVVTAELLTSIFVTSTPLHDGAVIIQGDRIACASAYFPPTNLELPSRYGARHRAAIGLSEVTDSITIVVSEETGRISIAEEGKLTSVDKRELRDFLLRVVCNEEKEVKSKPIVKKEEIKSFFLPEDVTKIETEEFVEADVNSEEQSRSKASDLLGKMTIKKQKTAPIEAEEIVTPIEKAENHKANGFFGMFKKKDKTKSMETLEKEEMDIKLPKKKSKKENLVEPDADSNVESVVEPIVESPVKSNQKQADKAVEIEEVPPVAQEEEMTLNELKPEIIKNADAVEEKVETEVIKSRPKKARKIEQSIKVEIEADEESGEIGEYFVKKPKRKPRKTLVASDTNSQDDDGLVIEIKAANTSHSDTVLDDIHLEFSASEDQLVDDFSTDFKDTDEEGSR